MNHGSSPDSRERQSDLSAIATDRSGAGQAARFQSRRASKNGVPVTGPVAVSVLLHAVLVALMWANIDFADEIVQVPRHIQAVMIDEETLQSMLAASTAQPEKEPAPEPEPEPPKPEPPKPEPEQKPEPPKPDPEVVRLKAEQKAAEDAAEQARLAAEKEQARLAALALKKKKNEEQRKLEEQARAEKRKKDEALAKEDAAAKAKKKREEDEFLKQQQLAKEKQRELDRQARQKERDVARQKQRDNAEERRLAEQASKFDKMFDRQSSSSSQTNSQISTAKMESISRERNQLIAQITDKIEKSWIEPPGRNRGLEVDIRLELLPTGELKTARIVSGSGNSGFDQSALQAAFAVSRYPVPRDVALFNRDFRNITIKFRPH